MGMKYLFYNCPSGTARAGLTHWMSNLNALSREAAWLGRIAVFPDCTKCLSPSHNLGYPVRSSWETYWDLENIEVTFNLGGGHNNNFILSAMAQAEFNALGIPTADILRPDNEHIISAEENARYQAIIRNMTAGLWRMSTPQLFDHHAFAHAIATPVNAKNQNETVKVTLNPSHKVLEMAGHVIGKLPNDYYGIHIRRGDCLQFHKYAKITSPKFILKKLGKVGIRAGATLFVMTDEQDERYLDFLKAEYRVIRYTDFPKLKSLITFPEPIDNYLLFMVENEVLKHARQRIYTVQNSKHLPANAYFLDHTRRNKMGITTLAFKIKSKFVHTITKTSR